MFWGFDGVLCWIGSGFVVTCGFLLDREMIMYSGETAMQAQQLRRLSSWLPFILVHGIFEPSRSLKMC